MLGIKTILHATDFSPCSDLALQLAGALARDYRARLVILHVGRPPVQPHGGVMTAAPPLAEEWGRDELERQLRRRTVPDLDPAPDHRLEFADGAGDEILRVAAEAGCDLIVLGTHGRSGVGKLLLGSVAEQVVRRAPCPVLTVRHGAPAGR
jgi:nucleotide-binding universal stress UspA family protein